MFLPHSGFCTNHQRLHQSLHEPAKSCRQMHLVLHPTSISAQANLASASSGTRWHSFTILFLEREGEGEPLFLSVMRKGFRKDWGKLWNALQRQRQKLIFGLHLSSDWDWLRPWHSALLKAHCHWKLTGPQELCNVWSLRKGCLLRTVPQTRWASESFESSSQDRSDVVSQMLPFTYTWLWL